MVEVKLHDSKKPRHTFPKGDNWNGNRNGRPKNPEVEELRIALKQAAKEQKKTFIKHFVDRAYRDDTVAIALGKKILPDKMEGEMRDIIIRMINYGGDTNTRS